MSRTFVPPPYWIPEYDVAIRTLSPQAAASNLVLRLRGALNAVKRWEYAVTPEDLHHWLALAETVNERMRRR